MPSLRLEAMRGYLAQAMTTNKVRGLLAEVAFRDHLRALGFENHMSIGGWIARTDGDGNFGRSAVALFADPIRPDQNYAGVPSFNPPAGHHAVCAMLHQAGVLSYYCGASIARDGDASSVIWYSKQLGVPTETPVHQIPVGMPFFRPRQRRYKFLRNDADISLLPDAAVPEEFAKENLRVSFMTGCMAEAVDLDGILWGERHTYPVEVKEKTVAFDNRVGPFFGLDVGPFAKLAFFTARRGSMRSLFVVREVNAARELLQWWYIPFDELVQFASWVPIRGGTGMAGEASSVFKIPQYKFRPLDKGALGEL